MSVQVLLTLLGICLKCGYVWVVYFDGRNLFQRLDFKKHCMPKFDLRFVVDSNCSAPCPSILRDPESFIPWPVDALLRFQAMCLYFKITGLRASHWFLQLLLANMHFRGPTDRKKISVHDISEPCKWKCQNSGGPVQKAPQDKTSADFKFGCLAINIIRTLNSTLVRTLSRSPLIEPMRIGSP